MMHAACGLGCGMLSEHACWAGRRLLQGPQARMLATTGVACPWCAPAVAVLWRGTAHRTLRWLILAPEKDRPRRERVLNAAAHAALPLMWQWQGLPPPALQCRSLNPVARHLPTCRTPRYAAGRTDRLSQQSTQALHAARSGRKGVCSRPALCPAPGKRQRLQGEPQQNPRVRSAINASGGLLRRPWQQ